MKQTMIRLSFLLAALLLFMIGLTLLIFPIKAIPSLGVVCIVVSLLTYLLIGVAAMIRAKHKFGLKFTTILKIVISVFAFILFTIGLGLFLVAKMIVLGLILAGIGLLAILFLIPMFVAFVRANPFEHIIISPDYDDIDTEFFSKRHERSKKSKNEDKEYQDN